MFNETVSSLNNLTIDEVLWLSEMIEIDQTMTQCWDIEHKRKAAKDK